MSKNAGKSDAPELPAGVILRHTLAGHKGPVASVAFDPLSGVLGSGGYDKTARIWDPLSGDLLSTLPGHDNFVYSVAFDSHGTLATGCWDNNVRLWKTGSGELLNTLRGHTYFVNGVAFDRQEGMLASGGSDKTVRLWRPENGKELGVFRGHRDSVTAVAFDPTGKMLASGSDDCRVALWDTQRGGLSRFLEGHTRSVWSVPFHPGGHILASASNDSTIRIWEPQSGKLLRILEGHTAGVEALAFSPDGGLLASKSLDNTVRLWRCDTWQPVACLPVPTDSGWWLPAIAFHPTKPLLATGHWEPRKHDGFIDVWELDYSVLLGRTAKAAPAVHHTTARIVLVGNSGVGKTGLGWRLAQGHFKEHVSTHGQQFWVCGALGTKRADGTECEAVLWDLAGQPDYRIIHSLFLDDADLALVLFDPTDERDPLHGVEFWLKQLGGPSPLGAEFADGAATHKCQILLVAARCDRGDSRLTQEELKAFCEVRGLAGFVRTSARAGDGIDDLLTRMKQLVAWENKSATTTSVTFKRIKDYVLGLKETGTDGRVIVSSEELRGRLEATDGTWRFTDDELSTAVGHLETYGYVRRLRTSGGEPRVLLAPELLNNLASSFVLEARRNPRGLGALEERRLLGDVERYAFPELGSLATDERTILTDAATLLFLKHHVCFREVDPLTGQPFLIFPELINLKRPVDEDKASEEGVAYTVSGAVENVFASLVVLLGYTSTFTRIAHWQGNARYEVADGSVCGFRLAAERDSELDLVLCFSPAAPLPVRMLFQGLFESCLGRRNNLNVMRYEPVSCRYCGNRLSRSVVRQRLQEGKTFAFCNDCGERLALSTAEGIQQPRAEPGKVDQQRRQAKARTRFEEAIFRVQAYVKERGIKPPQCFISYAWGVNEHERWVEKSLAADLQKAGIDVVLDRWHNAKISADVARFVGRIEKVDRVIVVGTPDYRRKYDNKDTTTGYVVAAEVDMLNNRLLGTERQKETVLPILLAGEKTASLPPLLHGRVNADFRSSERYFATAFDLILSIYDLPSNHPAVTDLVESLKSDFRNSDGR